MKRKKTSRGSRDIAVIFLLAVIIAGLYLALILPYSGSSAMLGVTCPAEPPPVRMIFLLINISEVFLIICSNMPTLNSTRKNTDRYANYIRKLPKSNIDKEIIQCELQL